MADPRYKNNVYTNKAGERRQAAAVRRNQQLDCNPLNWGWELASEDEAGRMVYTQAGLEMRYIYEQRAEGFVEGWFVAKVGEVEGMMNFCIPYLTIEPIISKLSTTISRNTGSMPTAARINRTSRSRRFKKPSAH